MRASLEAITLPSFAEAASVVRVRYKTLVEDPEGLETVYDNAPDPHLDNEPWSRFTLRFGASDLIEVGARPTIRTNGVALVQLFHPVETGDGLLLELADRVALVFRRITVSGVKFITPSIQNVGRDGKWWQVNVSCPFRCDAST